ncbi:MAG: glycosyl hydrolase family 39 [Bacteroidetes bacterium]|nr:glycosyl hydrolase family 39 [Bacteroidota bacterium]MBS1975450.1 glycosyl hydrolase family 39 [Bacteroidota bacterium]
MLHKNSPIHDAAFKALEALHADYVRYVPWFPYPKMVVAEIKPPTKKETFWDFSYADSVMSDFMEATKGHSVVINFSTTPAWMWKNGDDVKYPEDPYQVFWDYNHGTELKDTTAKQIADYYARLFSWYTKGGFTDELGKFHKSGHYYKIPYWEVLNEVNYEHNMSPRLYTKIYDAIVTALKKISPGTKFIGMALAQPDGPEWFEYFLDHKNHKPGVPLDGISYHHYSSPLYRDQKLDDYQYTFFDQANAFLGKVRFIESIRKRLSPHTITTINELGVILGRDTMPDNYWNLAGAMYAYLYLELAKLGIEVAGESQLVGYPTQFPDVTMINWKNGNPNSRYWVLKLLLDHFGPGDKLAGTSFNGADIIAQAFITSKGKRILLINPRKKDAPVKLPMETTGAAVFYVDVTTGENPPARITLADNSIMLKPFEVAVIELKQD